MGDGMIEILTVLGTIYVLGCLIMFYIGVLYGDDCPKTRLNVAFRWAFFLGRWLSTPMDS